MKTSELTGNSGELEKDLRDAAAWDAASPYEAKLFLKAAEELASLKQQLAEAHRENEELRGKLEVAQAAATAAISKSNFQAVTNTELNALRQELAALKAQSTEQPVAWTEQTFYEDSTPNPCSQLVWAGENDCDDFPIGTRFYLHPPKQESTGQPVARVMYNYSGVETDNIIDCDLPVGTLLYTTPPTATALVADFKRRVKEAIRNERLVDDTGTEGDEAYNTALDHAENAIESLPLIGEK